MFTGPRHSRKLVGEPTGVAGNGWSTNAAVSGIVVDSEQHGFAAGVGCLQAGSHSIHLPGIDSMIVHLCRKQNRRIRQVRFQSMLRADGQQIFILILVFTVQNSGT
jgi:hypothetical protein